MGEICETFFYRQNLCFGRLMCQSAGKIRTLLPFKFRQSQQGLKNADGILLLADKFLYL